MKERQTEHKAETPMVKVGERDIWTEEEDRPRKGRCKFDGRGEGPSDSMPPKRGLPQTRSVWDAAVSALLGTWSLLAAGKSHSRRGV